MAHLRAGALASLGSLVAAAAFVPRSPGPRDVVVAEAGLAAAVLLGWRAAIRRGRTRGAAAAGALAGVAAVLAALRSRPARAASVLALAGLSVAAGGSALASAQAAAARRTGRERPVPRPSRPVLLLNPASGGGKPTRLDLPEEARARGVEPIEIDDGDDVAEVARGAVRDGADALGMAGGDGSQALVAAVAAEYDVPFVCVPAGTRNHLALDLGLERGDVRGALDAFVDGVERRLDLARVGDRPFVNNVSLGLFAAVVQAEGYRERKLRTTTEILSDLLQDHATPIELRYALPDGSEETANLVIVSNNRYDLRGLGAVPTRERLDGGELGVIAVRVETPAEAAELGALEVAGHPDRFPGWRAWTAPEVVLESDGTLDAAVDGEATRLDPPLRFSLQPAAVRVRLPRHHPRISPASARRRLGRYAVGRLVRMAAGLDLGSGAPGGRV